MGDNGGNKTGQPMAIRELLHMQLDELFDSMIENKAYAIESTGTHTNDADAELGLRVDMRLVMTPLRNGKPQVEHDFDTVTKTIDTRKKGANHG